MACMLTSIWSSVGTTCAKGDFGCLKNGCVVCFCAAAGCSRTGCAGTSSNCSRGEACVVWHPGSTFLESLRTTRSSRTPPGVLAALKAHWVFRLLDQTEGGAPQIGVAAGVACTSHGTIRGVVRAGHDGVAPTLWSHPQSQSAQVHPVAIAPNNTASQFCNWALDLCADQVFFEKSPA